jgi:hypothetical protein
MSQFIKKLTPYEYFVQLQIEYIGIAVRTTIYKKPTNREYWEKIRINKRIKIEEFAQKNNLKTIFSDGTFRSDIEKLFYENGIPNFNYRNEVDEKRQKPFDMLAYYEIGSDVSFLLEEDGAQHMGKISSYKLNDAVIEVITVDNEKAVLPLNQVRRILFDVK